MISDLISRSELKSDLKQYFSDGTLESVSAKLAFNMILRKIDESPTVEPNELILIVGKRSGKREMLLNSLRPHGEWIRKPNKYRVNICCTNCGYDDGYSCFKYCPNCGADMQKKIQTPSCLTNPERQAELLERYKEE